MEQGTKEWLELRRTKIGASDAAVILGISPYKTPFQLWEEKVFGKDQEQNGAMARGSAMEQEARECFEKMTGLSVMPKVFVQDWRMASLDGITFDGKTLVEIKCPNKQVHALAEEGLVPDYYMAQMQHQFAVSGADKGYYFSYSGGKGILVEVAPQPEFIYDMMILEEKFWHLMVNKEAPPLSERDYIDKRYDKMWEIHAQLWLDSHYALKKAELDEEVARKHLLELSEGRNALCSKVKVTRSFCKGAVDYKLVPELIGVDLELYRKPPCEKWRLSAITKDET
jgi:putative phage-type endonuclease